MMTTNKEDFKKSKRKIIKSAEVLRSNYLPEKLLFREGLIEDIISKIEIGTGNIIIHGDTGSGKTASVITALKKQNQVIVIFINCIQHNTYTSIAKKIIEKIKNCHYNERGKNRSIISDELKKTLKNKRKKRIVIVFDEVDKLINKDRDHQQILNPILESIDSNIILISNEIDALRNLDARLESRLSPEKKFVPQYFSDQIYGILKERARLGLERGSYDLKAIAKISQRIFQTSGDIREALNLLYVMANLAQKKGCRITVNLFEEAKNTVNEIEFDEIFASLPLHQKIIIVGITKLSLEGSEGYAEHKRLYNLYESLARKKESEAVGFRQFERLLKKIELIKLIEITTRSPTKTRRGRLVVSFPKFDVYRFVKQYMLKYNDINDTAHTVGERT